MSSCLGALSNDKVAAGIYRCANPQLRDCPVDPVLSAGGAGLRFGEAGAPARSRRAQARAAGGMFGLAGPLVSRCGDTLLQRARFALGMRLRGAALR